VQRIKGWLWIPSFLFNGLVLQENLWVKQYGILQPTQIRSLCRLLVH